MNPREYPSRPLVGAGAVVHRAGLVLLVRRKFPPNRGRWALPGGLVELGETPIEAAVRETLEETGLRIAVERLLDVATDIHRDRVSKIKYDYVLVDYQARPIGGKLKLNSESSSHGWYSERDIRRLTMSDVTRHVLTLFFKAMAKEQAPR